MTEYQVCLLCKRIVCTPLCSNLVGKTYTFTMTTRSHRIFGPFNKARLFCWLWLQYYHNVYFMVGGLDQTHKHTGRKCHAGLPEDRFVSVHFHGRYFFYRHSSLRFQPLTSAVMTHGSQSTASPSGKQQHDLTAIIIMWKPHSQMCVCLTHRSSWK